jgi:hypothetical protein
MNNLVINPNKYRLSLTQIEALASEFLVQALESTVGDELTIEFDSAVNLNKFKTTLNSKFLKD